MGQGGGGGGDGLAQVQSVFVLVRLHVYLLHLGRAALFGSPKKQAVRNALTSVVRPCSFDEEEIGHDGTVPFRSGERISFTYLISKKYTGDEVGDS